MHFVASSYPLLNAFWTMIIFFAWILWFWFLFMVFGDLFSRHDIGGLAKTGWVVAILVLPFVGTFIYLISQSKSMSERRIAQAQAQQSQFDDYVKSVAATSRNGSAGEISRAKELLDSGAITPAEYEQLKSKALAG